MPTVTSIYCVRSWPWARRIWAPPLVSCVQQKHTHLRERACSRSIEKLRLFMHVPVLACHFAHLVGQIPAQARPAADSRHRVSPLSAAQMLVLTISTPQLGAAVPRPLDSPNTTPARPNALLRLTWSKPSMLSRCSTSTSGNSKKSRMVIFDLTCGALCCAPTLQFKTYTSPS